MAQKTIRLSLKTIKQVKKYLAIVRSAGIPVESALIFGSQAKGTARSDSDIDLAIISPLFGKDYFDERVRLMHLIPKNYIIEPHPMHPNDLEDKWSTFTHEVKTWGIPV